MILFHLCYSSRLAFERALSLDPHCTGAMTGLAILELNSKKVGSGLCSMHFLPSLTEINQKKFIVGLLGENLFREEGSPFLLVGRAQVFISRKVVAYLE